MKRLPSAILALLLLTVPAQATSSLTPAEFAGLAFHQNIGTRLPLRAVLHDEAGREVSVGTLLVGRPAVVVFAYFRCPNLCGLATATLARTLDGVSLQPGRDFDVLVVSVDPREGPADASAARTKLAASEPSAVGLAGWQFLTGGEASLRRLADAAGFPFRYDPANDQYAHPVGLVLTAADGTLTRYIPGLDYTARDLRFGLIDASSGRLAAPSDRLLMLCYGYDPATGRYSVLVGNLMKLTGLASALALGGFIAMMARGRRSG